MQIELRLHEILFFMSALVTILLMIWLVSHYESATTGWLLIALVLAGTAAGSSVWNYRYFRRLLKELENA